MTRTLIKGGVVLSMSQVTGNHLEADVLIDGDAITEIGPSLRARDATVVDAGDHESSCPGSWTPTAMYGNRCSGSRGRPRDHRPGRPVRLHYSADDLYAATLIGLLGAAEAGISTVVDWCEVNTDDAHTDAALQAHADSGLRTVFAFAGWGGDRGGWRGGLRRLAATRAAPTSPSPPGPRRRPGTTRTGPWPELGLRIHAHAGTSDSGERLASHDLLGADVTLVHARTSQTTTSTPSPRPRPRWCSLPASELARGVPTLRFRG